MPSQREAQDAHLHRLQLPHDLRLLCISLIEQVLHFLDFRTMLPKAHRTGLMLCKSSFLGRHVLFEGVMLFLKGVQGMLDVCILLTLCLHCSVPALKERVLLCQLCMLSLQACKLNLHLSMLHLQG